MGVNPTCENGRGRADPDERKRGPVRPPGLIGGERGQEDHAEGDRPAGSRSTFRASASVAPMFASTAGSSFLLLPGIVRGSYASRARCRRRESWPLSRDCHRRSVSGGIGVSR
jgi:hypothetical protein